MRNDLSNRLKALALTGQKGVAWLIDPDDVISTEKFKSQLSTVEHLHLDFIFLGGSLIQENTVSMIIKNIKEALPEIPIILFPGNVIQFSPLADG
ncbi:MAG: geranylgeranylglyceryl/heptaprenylglyceryl phosphate synthase, partial [Cyclobacteriaceae bacterium]|nr:geranylgeranylglyceryl/heptaprenylglyceryl phosphate synthase [Cyclobacteriaceae bacterium]